MRHGKYEFGLIMSIIHARHQERHDTSSIGVKWINFRWTGAEQCNRFSSLTFQSTNKFQAVVYWNPIITTPNCQFVLSWTFYVFVVGGILVRIRHSQSSSSVNKFFGQSRWMRHWFYALFDGYQLVCFLLSTAYTKIIALHTVCFLHSRLVPGNQSNGYFPSAKSYHTLLIRRKFVSSVERERKSENEKNNITAKTGKYQLQYLFPANSFGMDLSIRLKQTA